MGAPAAIVRLVEQFQAQREMYVSADYSEAQLRQEFINPFFQALGWDVYNEKGYSDAYKEVIHEAAIKVGGRTKAPDYCFRAGGGKASFFVEPKKPAVEIGEAIEPAYQLRRYAWSAKLPVSILTDFEELAVYDCRIRPVKTDKAAVARTLFCTFREYLDRWDELVGLFSPEAIRRGALERFLASKKVKKGTAAVDAAFLAEIETWRDSLARHIALRNPGISPRDLNFAVQRTVDRIVFLRICEDRGIEPYGTLQSLLNGASVYRRLAVLFQRADERYNSGLFHFTPEKDRSEPPDELTLNLSIDDKPLKDILQSLYYPESPYEFSVLPAEILGQVYEQFLGKVIRLTKGHQAKVEEKPEVRKAGGVYYTPAYIVDYIVEHTVGKLLEGKTPAQAARLRILDPACGSGSFLIGAYQRLLDWHRDQYVAVDAEKHARGRDPRLYRGAAGDWRLTTSERKRILLNNIYGVDIDPQAVEVTKLSLLLKVLEGESKETVNNQLRLFHERALPDLGRNVKCGNSLIGPEFYRNHQKSLFDEEEMYRINAFDWRDPKHGFGEIMRAGGFDAVIGNPPYVRIQTLNETQPEAVGYFSARYQSASQGNYDIYVLFIERGISLLAPSGTLGYICPHKFFNAKYGAPLCSVLAEGRHVSHVVHFGHQQVFDGPTTYTCLLFLQRSGVPRCKLIRVDDLEAWRATGQGASGVIPASTLARHPWKLLVGGESRPIQKLDSTPLKLGDVAHLFVGVQTDADEVFILQVVRQSRNKILCKSRATGKNHWFEAQHLKPFLKGSLNIRRYHLANVNKRLLFPYEIVAGKSLLMDPASYEKRYPLTWAYLLENRSRLRKRDKGRLRSAWYGYVYKKNHTRFLGPKLLAPSIASGSCFAADFDGIYYFVGSGGGGGGGYGIRVLQEAGLSDRYVLAVLNSRVTAAYLRATSTPFRGGYIALNRQYIENVPIPRLDLSNRADRARHDRMVELVDGMLGLHKRLGEVRTEHEKEVLRRQIEATDRQIDQLVYELYGLSDEEIKIVEEATR